MKKLLGRFKQAIQNLRMGTVSEGIGIKFCLNDEDGNRIRAHHGELLLPYWKECAAALRRWSEYYADESSIKVFIRFIETPKVVLDVLRPAFEQSRIKVILFCGSGHPGDTADFARKVLQMNHFLTEIALLRSCSLMRI